MKGLLIGIIVALALPALASPEAPEPSSGTITGPIVELNRATVEELQSLPGIGLKKAEAIIAQREKRPFTRVTQLLLVKGIGQKTLTRLKPRLAVRPMMTPAAAGMPALPPAPEPTSTPTPMPMPTPPEEAR